MAPQESSDAQRAHYVHRVHRIGGALLAAGLVIFGVLGLADMPTFFSTRGPMVMGMGSNGALAVLSVVVGLVLAVASVRGGPAASTTSLVVGILFLASGFVHLAILDTAANVLAFRLPNVFFSFAAGVVLTSLGAYGRMSGGLSPDSPYGARRPGRDSERDGPREDVAAAEQAAATRHATPEQQALLASDHGERATASYERAWSDFAATHSEADVRRLRAVSDAESNIPPRERT